MSSFTHCKNHTSLSLSIFNNVTPSLLSSNICKENPPSHRKNNNQLSSGGDELGRGNKQISLQNRLLKSDRISLFKFAITDLQRSANFMPDERRPGIREGDTRGQWTKGTMSENSCSRPPAGYIIEVPAWDSIDTDPLFLYILHSS